MGQMLRGWRVLSALALIAVGLVMGASVAGAQAAPAPSDHASSLSSAQFHTNPGHFLSGPQPHVAGQSYAANSSNWSGQLATGLSFTGVTGDWVVPAVQPTSYPGISATWIGIDGGPGSPNSIIQTGTDQSNAKRCHVLPRLVRALPGATGLLRQPSRPETRCRQRSPRTARTIGH